MIVLVLGVHRSGTSLLTAGLEAIGCATGDISEFADDHNPKGYFEHPVARGLSEELLHLLGVSWDNWGFYAGSYDIENPDLDGWYHRAAEFLREFAGTASIVALKDPRIATLFPFWNRVIERTQIDCRRIVIVRDPAEVAESQFRRAMRAPTQTMIIADREPMSALWAITMLSLLQSIPDRHNLLLKHSTLYADPKSSLQACARFVGLDPEPATVDNFVTNFFEPTLRRSIPGREDVGGWSAMASRLYSALADLEDYTELSGVSARAIASTQTQLISQIPLLRAVKVSLARLLEASERRSATLKTRANNLSQAMWAINDLTLPRHDIKARPAMATLEELATTDDSDFSLGILSARLAIQGKCYDAAERILRSLSLRFPSHSLPGKMLHSLSEARAREASLS